MSDIYLKAGRSSLTGSREEVWKHMAMVNWATFLLHLLHLSDLENFPSLAWASIFSSKKGLAYLFCRLGAIKSKSIIPDADT